MIDLSFLTEEEQEMILGVLKRDADLKKSEEQRIKQLQKSVKDRGRLKYLTGEWFYETKYDRHRDRIHGSDIIRASMKQRKPVTILELTQRWSEKQSAYGDKKDLYIPPELSGLIEDPFTHIDTDSLDDESQRVTERPHTKPRQNPFNILRRPRNEAKPVNGYQEAEQTLADGQHEPQNSQVSTSHGSSEVLGKASALVKASKTQKVTVEESRPFTKIFGWFRRSSRNRKQNQAQVTEDVNDIQSKRQECQVENSPSSDPTDVETLMMPTSKHPRRLLAAFSGAEKTDMSLEVQGFDKTESETSWLLNPEPEDRSLQQASYLLDKRVDGLFFDDNKLENLSKDVSQREHLNQDEASPGRLAELKSFWESGNRCSEIQSSKTHDEVEESETSQKYRPANFNISPSNHDARDPNTNMSNAEATTDGTILVSPRRTSLDVDILFIPSDEEEHHSTLDNLKLSEIPTSEPKSVDYSQNLPLNPEENFQAGEIQEESICRDISDLKKEISNFKKSLCQHEDKVKINDLKSFWEKEKCDFRQNVGLQISTGDVADPSQELGQPSDHFHSTSNSPRFKKIGWFEQKEVKEKAENKGGESTRPSQDLRETRGSVIHTIQNVSEELGVEMYSKPSQSSPIKKSESQLEKPQSTDTYQPKVQDRTRTPSPLRHFKVPRRDSYPNQDSARDGSPLRTFPINIDRTERSPSTVGLKSGQTTLLPSPEKHGASDARSIISKERKLSADSLTRFYIPLSLENYLGLPKQKALNERHQVQVGEVFKRGNQVSNESSPSRHSLVESEEITFDSSGSTTPEAWSISHTTLCWDSGDEGSLKAALERANARPISISKSLEDLASTPLLSAVSSNTKTSFSDPEQVKMISMSVPAFLQHEMDRRNSDCASESSFDRLKTCNTPSNVSTLSEVASVSSVTGSVMSIYGTEFCHVEVRGTIQFAIHYVQKLGEFHIFIVQCKDLAVADFKRNRSDPYVKCYLLPDKSKYGKRKTCVRKKTLNPSYNEILRFKIPMEMLKTQKLNVSVWHNDTFGRNSFLGEVEVDLDEWDCNTSQMNEYHLKGRIQILSSPKLSIGSDETKAGIKVALRFLPQTSMSHKSRGNGEVQIWVKECKNLPISRGVAIDPFVKCAFLPDTSRRSRQKTKVLKRASNPVFNHTMVFDGFKKEDLKEVCAELTVWDHDKLNNHFIGGIRLGCGKGKSYGTEVSWMDSNGAEAALWERMVKTQNEWVEDTLPLRMIVMARVHRYLPCSYSTSRRYTHPEYRLRGFTLILSATMITRKRVRSTLNVDNIHSDTTETSVDILETNNSSEMMTYSSPESDTNDWGLNDLIGSEFNWDLDKDVLDVLSNLESQSSTSDDINQSAVVDVSTSRSCGTVKRSKLQDMSGRIINKNAIAARMNRLKKKEYISGLEQRVGSLATENRALKHENGNLSKRVDDLENETRYLRAVLANESMLAQLLSRLSGVNGMKFSTSLFQESNENDHDYAMPMKKVKVEHKETAGGVCLHVDKDHVSVEFCTKCAESSSLSHKM
ncbi:hypothetical protein DNTS_021662 [Danionella cerebrum]|uniref:Synaptotagmin-like protein 2 n=2 Tax=Cyprinoidei TaxID=30727 RepID=A0A553QM10_9TELE|nr:hypothetical protein DNTS_021662 [Danionella translucida]